MPGWLIQGADDVMQVMGGEISDSLAVLEVP